MNAVYGLDNLNNQGASRLPRRWSRKPSAWIPFTRRPRQLRERAGRLAEHPGRAALQPRPGSEPTPVHMSENDWEAMIAVLEAEGVTVEADETFVGGKIREAERRKLAEQGLGNRGPATKPRPVVYGALERGGQVRARVAGTSRTADAARAHVRSFVLPGSMIYTDDWGGYKRLGKNGYAHRRVNHSARVYVDGDVHTNSIEGFFGLLKNGIRGVYHSVSTTHLQSYLDEYAFRYNRRDEATPMFWAILDRVEKTRPALPAS